MTAENRPAEPTRNTGIEPLVSDPDLASEREALINGGVKRLARFALRHFAWTHYRDRSRPGYLLGQKPAEKIIGDDQVAGAREIVDDMLSRMSERERLVVTAHYGLSGEPPRTFRDIGEGLQLSPSWVRDINSTALSARRIREPLDDLNELALKGRIVVEVTE